MGLPPFPMPTLRINAAWLSLIAALVVLALYSRTVEFGFVNYDDNVYLYENPGVTHGISSSSLKWALGIHGPSMWIPLTWISHQAMVASFGLEPGPHHGLNVLLHAANAALLYLLLWRWTGRPWRALLGALLFAIHPAHVESVAWITERKDVLALFFSLLALLCHQRFARHGEKLVYTGIFVCHLLAVMSKPLAVTLPCLMLLADHWPLGRDVRIPWWRLFLEKWPLLGVSAVACWLTLLCQWSIGAVGSTEQFPISGRLANAAISYAMHLRHFMWPVDLAVFYPYPTAQTGGVAISAGLTLVFLSVLFFRRRCDIPSLWTGWLWFLGSLVPMIGLIQAGSASMADRYAYLPYLGLYMGVVFALDFRRPLICALSMLILTGLAVTSYRQISVWRSSETLFRHALTVTSGNHLAHNNLGMVYKERGETEAARREFSAAIRIRPDYLYAVNNLATLDGEAGRFEEAGIALEKVVTLQPTYAAAWHNLGKIRAATGEVSGSITAFETAIHLAPDFLMPRYDLAGLLISQNRHTEALPLIQALNADFPAFTDGWINCGFILGRLGRDAESITAYRQALRISPANPLALRNLISALTTSGATESARQAWDQAHAAAAMDARLLKEIEAIPRP
jgi:protein O-mannosyl-transferase